MSKNHIPLISVIVPVYNVQNYIVECLESIRKQSFKDFEVIIVDDCSSDNSVPLVNNYIEEKALSDNFFFYKNETNSGLSVTRNNGIEKSVGSYICFIDSDDWVDDDYLDDFHKALLKFPATEIVINEGYVKFYENDLREEIVNNLSNKEISMVDKKVLYKNINKQYCIYTVQGCFKRFLFNNVHFPPDCDFEDLLTLPLIFFRADNFASFSDPNYHYRRRNGSITMSFSRVFHSMEMIQRNKFFWKAEGLLDLFYERYSKTIRDQIYGIVYWADSREKSMEVLNQWSNDLSFRFLLEMIRYKQLKHFPVLLMIKLSPFLTYKVYRMIKDK